MVYAYMLYGKHEGNDCKQINVLSNRLHRCICYIVAFVTSLHLLHHCNEV